MLIGDGKMFVLISMVDKHTTHTKNNTFMAIPILIFHSILVIVGINKLLIKVNVLTMNNYIICIICTISRVF